MATTFLNLLETCFYSRFSPTTRFTPDYYYGEEITSLEEGKGFMKFMKINLEEEEFEIPCVYKYLITSILRDNIAYTQVKQQEKVIDTLILPVMALRKDTSEARTSNAIIRKFFHDTNPRVNLMRKSASGTVYLGGEGMILYEDLTPLMMMTVKVRKTIDYDRIRYTFVKPIIRINPIIYIKDDILAKYIRSKFISNVYSFISPGGYSRDIFVRNTYNVYSTNHIDFSFLQILIEDFSNFFITPEIPDITFSEDSIYNMLNNNVEDLLKS